MHVIPRHHQLMKCQRPHRTAPEHPKVHARHAHLRILHPPSIADVLVLATDALDINLDDMSANYGSPSTHPSTPSAGVIAHTNSTPTGLPPGVCSIKNTLTMVHRPHSYTPAPFVSCTPASSCIIHDHRPQPQNLPPGTFSFFTLLPTWAVCEIPSSHCTLCHRGGTHATSLRPYTLTLYTLCIHRASTPGAHG